MKTLAYRTCLSLLIAVSYTAGASEVFQDLELTHGFGLSAVESTMKPLEVADILVLDNAKDPVWRLAQWGTRFDLQAAAPNIQDGVRMLRNAGKSITVHPGGLAGEGVTLEVLGGIEYDGGLRKRGEAWPHLLVEQRLEPGQRLSRMASLPFTVAFKVDYCRNATDKTLDPGLHTAHITAFWTIHNRNPESDDAGDMIWFGVPLFDARHPIPGGHQAVDVGKDDATGKFICTIEGERFFDGPTGDGAWHAVNTDLLPLIQEALEASQAKGFLTDTTFEDLEPSSFNLGWEVPGPYDCAITLKGLSLKTVPKPQP